MWNTDKRYNATDSISEECGLSPPKLYWLVLHEQEKNIINQAALWYMTVGSQKQTII
jgi:hypothetical protein